MSTPKHCPGFEAHKDLKAFVCKCPNCQTEKEIFSDEFDREHTCPKCGEKIDFSKCTIEA
jgi:transcription initiation factor IIE alpha subunit